MSARDRIDAARREAGARSRKELRLSAVALLVAMALIAFGAATTVSYDSAVDVGPPPEHPAPWAVPAGVGAVIVAGFLLMLALGDRAKLRRPGEAAWLRGTGERATATVISATKTRWRRGSDASGPLLWDLDLAITGDGVRERRQAVRCPVDRDLVAGDVLRCWTDPDRPDLLLEF